MRICVVAHNYPRWPGDFCGFFVQELSLALHRLGHEIHMLLPHDPRMVEGLDGSPFRFHVFKYAWPESMHRLGYGTALVGDQAINRTAPIFAPVYFAALKRRLRRVAREHDIDIVHAHWPVPHGWLALKAVGKMGIPLINTMHGSDVFMGQRGWPFRGMLLRALDYASSSTACSPDLRDACVQMGADGDKIHLVIWGADPDLFDPAKTPVSGWREKWGFAPEDRVLVALGRLVEKKGFHVLIEAIGKLTARAGGEHVCCVILGDGPERARLVECVRSNRLEGKVALPGLVPIDQVPSALRECDALVMPSIPDRRGNLDGLPTVIPQAMAMGLPVIGSRVAGLPLILEDGVNGRLVPPNDSEALADAAMRLVTDEDSLRTMGETSRRLIVERHNWMEIGRFFESLMAKALAERRG